MSIYQQGDNVVVGSHNSFCCKSTDSALPSPPQLPSLLSSDDEHDDILTEQDYSNICVAEPTWNVHLQDEGCTKEEMPKKTYISSQISPIGPAGNKI